MSVEPLLHVENLTVQTHSEDGPRSLLTEIALQIGPGEIVGLVGESGSGKSMLAMSIGRLLPTNCSVTQGRVVLSGEDLLTADERMLESIRGSGMAFVFQEPMTALNPTMKVGRQMVDVIRRHTAVGRSDAKAGAIAMLERVRIRDAASVFDSWPHELSGGMRQRVLIGMAFSCQPGLIIADEPTTALDVTIQAQILALLVDMAREHGTSVLLITHDMGIVRAITHRVNVMYAGRIVECGATADVLAAPRHPYTRALLGCLPESSAPRARLATLPASGPSQMGCAFRSRCAHAFDECNEVPRLSELPGMHGMAACWLKESANVVAREARP